MNPVQMTRGAKLRLLLAVVTVSVALGGVWLTPGTSAGASVSSDDCQALETVNDSKTSLTGLGANDARSTSAAFAATAKKVEDKKLKAALLTMSSVYKSLGNSSSNAGKALVVAKNARKYGLAAATFSKTLVECITSQITLPKGVTLPSGITLPRNPTLSR